VKVGALAVAVFRSVAAGSSGSRGPALVSQIVADVSIDSPEGALVDRKKLDDAVTLLARSRLIDVGGDRLTLTAEGDHFWRRICHLPQSGMKKWIREAVDIYSRGEAHRWAVSEKVWTDAQALFLGRHRTRMTARLEVLDGLLTALENWHFVSSIIGAAADRDGAVAALQGVPFCFTKAQAIQIVDTRISQRTALGRLSLADERDAIRAELDELTEDDSPNGVDSLPERDTLHGPSFLEQAIEDLKHLGELQSSASDSQDNRLPDPEVVALRPST
jgi:hypothetical protein